MSVISGTSSWQVGPVSSFGRISAGALVALAADALFASPVLASRVLVALFVLAPVIVAVRVVRGFDGSLSMAMTTFATVAIASATWLVFGSAVDAARSALVVGIIVAIVGFAAAVAAWFDRRRSSQPPVIEIALPSRDGLARVRNRPRVYR